MKNFEFKWRDTGEKQILTGNDAADALNKAGFGGEKWRAFDWYREIIPPTIGFIPVLLGYAKGKKRVPVFDNLKFYAVAHFTQNGFYGVMVDWNMERQWIKVEDPFELKFMPGFSLEKDLVTID